MDFLSLNERRDTQEENRKVLTFFFLFCPTETQQKKKTKRNFKEKKTLVILFARSLQTEKEKRERERNARRSSSSSSPFTVLARCHAQFRHRFFERVSERNFKSSRVSNVMRF